MTGTRWARDADARLSAESRARTAACMREHREHWVVTQRHGNASAFNGYHWTPSDWSAVKCLADGCGRVWRTRAAYVDDLPDVR